MAQEYDKYGHSSYSQIPTDDKKYECRTGPFEGFFVSSVEFCKHVKFHDRVDKDRENRTGTPGPPSPQGPPGINGSNGAQRPLVLRDFKVLSDLMEHKVHLDQQVLQV